MNEQILELFEQALNEFKEEHKYATIVIPNPLKEKFAELLIRECARIAAQTPCPYEDEFAKQTYGHTWDMACVESAKDIRKHFGVK
jgi:hypothetical protein